MTDIVQSSTNYPHSMTITGNGHHRHDNEKVLEALGNATMHTLNSEQVTQKAVGDATRDVLLDQAAIKQQIGDVVDSLHQDGNATRADVKSEGRNLDNKVCDVEHHLADGFCRTNNLIQENKFELTKQNGQLERHLADKFSALNVEVIKQGESTRTALEHFERRTLEQKIQALEIKEACRNVQSETINIVNSNINASLGAITQAITHLSSSIK